MKEAEFRYYQTVVSSIVKNIFFLVIVFLLDYLIFGINMFITNYYINNKNSPFSKYKDDIFLLKMSPTYQLHSTFKDPDTAVVAPFVILVFFAIFNVISFTSVQMSERVKMIYVTINEFFVHRLFALFYFDIIFNRIVYYSKELHNGSVTSFVFLILFIVILIAITLTIFYHFIIFNSTCSLAVDFCFNKSTIHFEICFLILKLFVALNINLLEFSGGEEETIINENSIIYFNYFLNLTILSFILLLTSYYVFLCFSYSIYFIKNEVLTRLRLFFLLFLSSQSVIFITFRTHDSGVYIILSIVITLFILFICIRYDPETIVLHRMHIHNSLEQLLLIIYLTTSENKEDNQIKYIKNIRYHFLFCKNCFLCKEIQKVVTVKHYDLSCEKTEEIIHSLDIYHNIFLLKIESEMRKSKFSSFYYDFIFLIDLMRKEKSFNYQIQYLCKKIIERYKRNNEVNNYLNLRLVFENFVKSNSLKESTKFKLIEEHYLITEKIIQVIKFIKRITKGKIKSPKDFIALSEMLREFKSTSIRKFLGQRENMQLYSVVILRMIVEDVLSIPIRKEEGFIRRMKSYSDEFLDYHFINDKPLVLEVCLKQNQFIIRQAGRALNKYLNMELSKIFPPKMKKNGIECLKDLINTSERKKSFSYLVLIPMLQKGRTTTMKITDDQSISDESSSFNEDDYYENDNELEFYVLNFTFSVCPSMNKSDVTLIGEYIVYPNEVIITMSNEPTHAHNKNVTIDSPVHSSLELPYLNSLIKSKIGETSSSSGGELLYAVSQSLFRGAKLLYIKDLMDFQRRFSQTKGSKMSIFKKTTYNEVSNKKTACLANYFHKKDKDGNYLIQKGNEEYSIVYNLTIKTIKNIFKIYLLINTNSMKKTTNQGGHFGKTRLDDTQTMDIHQEINFFDCSSSIQTQTTTNSMLSMRYLQPKDNLNLNITKENHLTSYKNSFKHLTFAIFCFTYLIIIINVIALIVDFCLNNQLITINNIYNTSRETNRIYYMTLSSIFSSLCIGKLNSNECTNYFYEELTQLKETANLPSNPFHYIIYENQQKLIEMTSLIQQLKKSIYSINNSYLTKTFEMNVKYNSFGIVGDEIILSETEITFSSALEVLINSLTVVLNNDDYTKYPVYIITTGTLDLSNIYDKSSLTNWQFEYYNALINYKTYLLSWKHIQNELYKRVYDKLSLYGNIAFMFLCINYFLHFFLFGLLGIYLYRFLVLVIMDIEEIVHKTKRKDIHSFYKKKYTILKTLCKYYEKSPVKLIKQLDTIYKERQENAKISKIKTKGSNLHLKFEDLSKNENDTKLELSIYSDNSTEGDKEKYAIYISKYDKNFISSLYYSVIQRFFNIIIVSLLYYTVFFVVFIILWLNAISNTKVIISLVESISAAEASLFNDISLIQLMMLGNTTEHEISHSLLESTNLDEVDSSISDSLNNEEDSYLADDIVKAVKILFSYVKINKKNGNIIPRIQEQIELNCDNFYTHINDTTTYIIDNEHPEEEFEKTIIGLCKYLNLLEFSEEILVYKTVFYNMYQMLKLIKHDTYNGILEMLQNPKVFDIYHEEYFVIRQMRTWYNSIVYEKSIDDSTVYETTVLISYLVIEIISEISLVLVLYFLFFNRISQINKNLSLLINAFKTH